MEKHRCEGQVLVNPHWMRYERCSNNGKIKRNGKWYCGIHDPLKVAERRKKRIERLQEAQGKWKEVFERDEFNARCGDACRAAGIINPEALESLILELLLISIFKTDPATTQQAAKTHLARLRSMKENA